MTTIEEQIGVSDYKEMYNNGVLTAPLSELETALMQTDTTYRNEAASNFAKLGIDINNFTIEAGGRLQQFAQYVEYLEDVQQSSFSSLAIENVGFYNLIKQLKLQSGLLTVFGSLNNWTSLGALQLAKAIGKECPIIIDPFTSELASPFIKRNVNFLKADANKIPLQSNSIPIIVSSCLWDYIKPNQKIGTDPLTTTQNIPTEAYRILKPGGYLLMFEVTEDSKLFRVIEQELEDVGLEEDYSVNPQPYLFNNLRFGIETMERVSQEPNNATDIINAGIRAGRITLSRKAKLLVYQKPY